MGTNSALNVNASTPLRTDYGGTGASSPQTHTFPIAQGSSPFHFLGPLSNGQLLIGSNGTDPIAANLTAGANVTITNAAGTITIAASSTTVGCNYTAVSGNYTILVSDCILGVTNTSSPYTLTLPSVGMSIGQKWLVKDESGLAFTNNITISAGAKLIDGASSIAITDNYGALEIYYNGTNFFVF